MVDPLVAIEESRIGLAHAEKSIELSTSKIERKAHEQLAAFHTSRMLMYHLVRSKELKGGDE